MRFLVRPEWHAAFAAHQDDLPVRQAAERLSRHPETGGLPHDPSGQMPFRRLWS
jgi:hypothetical protein